MLFNLILFCFLATSLCSAEDEKKRDFNVEDIVASLTTLRDPYTKLSPSHWDHPGYEDLAFTYDKAVDALIFKASYHQKEAEEVLDYFADKLNIPTDEIASSLDTNGIYGVLKLVNKKDPLQGSLKTIINSVDITCATRQGRGELEFWTTPGPLSFLIFAFLQVNTQKYLDKAVMLGEVLLTMQNDDGGIRDGDRAPERVHTEPHMDGYDAFLMLYKVTNDEKWKKAAESAYSWFENNVFHPDEGTIDQGMWRDEPSTIFAEDAYSWVMAGPAGDKISLDVLKKLISIVLSQSLVKITLTVPEETSRTIVLCDFSNSQDPRVKNVRGGFHPLGSVEWTGGAILALQKNAVRFYNANDIKGAVFYKALAQILLAETMKCFYFVDTAKGQMSFYATGQGIEVAPFGSVKSGYSEGWKTPFFYAATKSGKPIIEGGSSVGAWPLLPYLGLNPFILDDNYKETYDKIALTQEDLNLAQSFIDDIVKDKTFNEPCIMEIPQPGTQIIEPARFNIQMWQALEGGGNTDKTDKFATSQSYYKEAIKWANETVSNPVWVEYAHRDNLLKKAEVGGIIAYPWGVSFPNNDSPLHRAILRYPLLNEVALAMWGLAVSYYKLGDKNKSKFWIDRIIDEVPLHQIAATKEGLKSEKGGTIIGYWNALVSWEDNPGGDKLDEEMGELYREVLREYGLSSAKPDVIPLPESYIEDADMDDKQ